MDDLNATSMEAAVSMIKGSARSMGVKVVDQFSDLKMEGHTCPL